MLKIQITKNLSWLNIVFNDTFERLDIQLSDSKESSIENIIIRNVNIFSIKKDYFLSVKCFYDNLAI